MIRELYSNEPNTLVYPIVSDIEPTDFTATIRVGNDRNKLTGIAIPLTATQVLPLATFNIVVSNDILGAYRYARIDIEYKLGDHGTIRDQFDYRVTKRYVRFPDMRALLTGEIELTEEQFNYVERDVRYQIEAYCNQKFDGWYGSQEIKSIPGYIALPEHLDHLEYVTRSHIPVDNANPIIAQRGFSVTEHGFAVINEEKVRVTDLYGERHGQKAYYTIRGQWGWSSVPAVVQQAAAALFQSKLCDDVEYRNKYVKSIRNENIRIEFNDAVYDGHTTGNAFVDDILLPYVAMPLGAI